MSGGLRVSDRHQFLGPEGATVNTLPCADMGLLTPLRQSPQYQSIRACVAEAKPVDAWQRSLKHYFSFKLHPCPELPVDWPAPTALFVMDFETDELVSVTLVQADAKNEPFIIQHI
jgi:hypothetical protein